MEKLPPETWAAIFELYSDNYLIMSICRAWRSVALTTPQLWTSIAFNRPHHFADFHLANVSQYIARSGACPLDVVVHVPASSDITFDFHGVTTLLRPHVLRFCTLNIHAGTLQVDPLITSLAKDQAAPLLECLFIETTQSPGPNSLPALSVFESAFHPAPRLTHLTLPAYQRLPLYPASPILSTIISLTLDARPIAMAPDVEAVLHFIASLPFLREFTYKTWDYHSWQDTSALDYSLSVYLPRLTTVDITAPGSGLDILRCIRAPFLISARLNAWRNEFYDDGWDSLTPVEISASLRRLSERSPLLKCLELSGFGGALTVDNYRWIFRHVSPGLEVLRLDRVGITDDALGGGACSSLRRLELKGCNNISDLGIESFAEGREKDFEVVLEDCRRISQENLDSRLSRRIHIQVLPFATKRQSH